MLRGRGARRGGGRRGLPEATCALPGPVPPPPGAAGQPGRCDPGPGLGRGRDLCAPRPEPECPVWERPPGLGSQRRPSAAGPGWASPLQAEAASASSENSAGVALRVSPASSIRAGLPHFCRGAVLRAPAVRRGRRSQPGPAEQGSRVFAPAGVGGCGEGGSQGSPESPWAPRAPVARAPFLPQAGPETPSRSGKGLDWVKVSAAQLLGGTSPSTCLPHRILPGLAERQSVTEPLPGCLWGSRPQGLTRLLAPPTPDFSS